MQLLTKFHRNFNLIYTRLITRNKMQKSILLIFGLAFFQSNLIAQDTVPVIKNQLLIMDSLATLIDNDSMNLYKSDIVGKSLVIGEWTGYAYRDDLAVIKKIAVSDLFLFEKTVIYKLNKYMVIRIGANTYYLINKHYYSKGGIEYNVIFSGVSALLEK